MYRLDHRHHRSLDYAAIAFLLLAPGVFGLTGVAAPLAYAWALAYVGLALLTAYPDGGLWRLAFTLHGRIEAGFALFAIAAPWLFSFANDARARNFFVLTGIALMTAWLTTDYRAAQSRPAPDGAERAP